MKVDFNTNILSELIAQREEAIPVIANKFPKVEDWQKQIEKPTFNQLVNLAKYFNIPFGYFFLNELPERKYPVPHYKSKYAPGFTPSDELKETIKTVEERQEWAKDILIKNSDPLYFTNIYSIKTNVSTAAAKIKEILNLDDNWNKQETLKNLDDVFRFLLKRTEEAGIFVVLNGIVNNNTKRKLKVSEFRGFVLFDEYAPFIFINNNDVNSGKTFTLIHEIAHILIGKSASFENKNLLPAHEAIEEFCDAVAAEFLMPKNYFDQAVKQFGKNSEEIAKRFKVSRMIVARKLFDNGIITQKEFINDYDSFKKLNVEKVAKKTNGGNFYNTAPYRISKRFFNLIYTEVKHNNVLYRDAFRITNLTPKSFDGYVKAHISKQ